MLIERDEVKVLLPPCVDILLSLLLVFDPVDYAFHIAAKKVSIPNYIVSNSFTHSTKKKKNVI